MREDLKERLRKLFHDNPVHVFHVLLDYWTGESVYIWDVGSTWIFGLGRTPWPDSRVESFLDWAEHDEQSWVQHQEAIYDARMEAIEEYPDDD